MLNFLFYSVSKGATIGISTSPHVFGRYVNSIPMIGGDPDSVLFVALKTLVGSKRMFVADKLIITYY